MSVEFNESRNLTGGNVTVGGIPDTIANDNKPTHSSRVQKIKV